MSQSLSQFTSRHVAIIAMAKPIPVSLLHGAVIHDVMLIDQLDRQHAGPFKSESLPGHLIHVVTRGEVEQRSGGITQHFGAGDAIWYYENEPVEGRILQTPWTFYTVNFRAPMLSSPPLDQRVRQAANEAGQADSTELCPRTRADVRSAHDRDCIPNRLQSRPGVQS